MSNVNGVKYEESQTARMGPGGVSPWSTPSLLRPLQSLQYGYPQLQGCMSLTNALPINR